MYTEDELLPVSSLQHLAFCERQWGLIHIEGIWDENRLTAEGRQLHDRAHSAGSETRGNLHIARGLRLRSLRLGLTGMADVVEFLRLPGGRDGEGTGHKGIRLEGLSGLWRPVPVEYKRGRPKRGRCDEVQLCAQALCLEEMLGVPISSGVLFYDKPHRRREISFDDGLRKETEELAKRLHHLTRIGKTPFARYEKKCRNCSLLSFCLPKVTGSKQSVARYLSQALEDAGRESE